MLMPPAEDHRASDPSPCGRAFAGTAIEDPHDREVVGLEDSRGLGTAVSVAPVVLVFNRRHREISASSVSSGRGKLIGVVPPELLPEDLQRFIRIQFTSIEEVEMLGVLLRTPERSWTVAELTSELGSVVASIRRRLEHLRNAGLAGEDAVGWRFTPREPEIARLGRAAAAAYRSHRISVTNLIYDRSPGQLSSFADSFRLRPEERS